MLILFLFIITCFVCHWTIAFISHDINVMPKILHAMLQYYVNQEFPDVQAVFRKGRGTRDQIANIHWIIEKAQKNIYLCFIGEVSVYNVGNLGSIPGSGRSPGEGNSNPLQYSCLENPMDGGTW